MVGLIGATSYGLAAAAFVVLTALLVISWRGRATGALLVIATIASALWASCLAYEFAIDSPGGRWWNILEILRNVTWFVFLTSLLTSAQPKDEVRSPAIKWFPRGLALICIVLVSGAALAPWFPQYQSELRFATDILGRIILAIAGMALVEFVYRNARPDQRWGIKFLCLGAGGMFAYDFYLYSDAMLFKQINAETFAARGIVNALVVPLVAVRKAVMSALPARAFPCGSGRAG